MRFWIDLGGILGPSWGPCGDPFGLRNDTGTPPRRSKTLPRRSQDAPKTLKDANKAPQEAPRGPKTPPSSILHEFFIDFHSFFIDCLANFHRCSKGFLSFFNIFGIILGVFCKKDIDDKVPRRVGRSPIQYHACHAESLQLKFLGCWGSGGATSIRKLVQPALVIRTPDHPGMPFGLQIRRLPR